VKGGKKEQKPEIPLELRLNDKHSLCYNEGGRETDSEASSSAVYAHVFCSLQLNWLLIDA